MDKERIEEIKEEIEELEERKEELENGDNEGEFQEHLNDSFGNVNICGFEMGQGDILKECDEVAFREMLNNWNDSEITEISDNIEELKEELKDLESEV